MKVKDFIKISTRSVITIGPDDTSQVAIEKLIQHNIGALPVCDAKGGLLGIISERDLLRKCSLGDPKTKGAKVKDLMTKEVAVGIPDDELDYVMNIMKQKGIRHLPIMDGPKLVNIISSRDIMEARLEECRVEVRNLHDYISGGYV
jgi:CBS domain-containing protein